MKTSKPTYILCAMVWSILLLSCNDTTSKKITNKEDYQPYLEVSSKESLVKIQNELEFWNSRIKQDSSQIIDLTKSAGLYSAIFQLNADIAMLKMAELNLTKSAQKAAISKDGYLRALAQNYITQHRFKEAKTLIDSAHRIGGEVSATNFVQFDIAMELGNYDEAEAYLKKETDFSEYNYLIRLAKWEDYSGNLDKTIQHMENAMDIAERSNVDGLKIWVYTNIADYYGHAGRIQDSYNHYIKALKVDPSNAYAKKGIAWITYSYENDAQEALRIIASIEKESKSPDYQLLKAQINQSLGNIENTQKFTKNFLSQTSNPQYGDMYGAYLVDIYADEATTANQAVRLATKEVNNRPTPMSYTLLSHAYYAQGNYDKALKIAQKHVINKTHEPMAQFHTAQIYKALSMSKELEPLKKDLLETAYELGPTTFKEIQNL